MIVLLLVLFMQAKLSSSTHYCELNNFENMTRQCGYCGLCIRADLKSAYGVCDFNVAAFYKLFVNASSECLLRNYCKENEGVCQQNITNHFTGLCIPLYGSVVCKCQPGYFGANCDYQVDSDTSLSAFAKINNVVYSPMFISSTSLEVYVSLLRRGINLEIVVDNGNGGRLFFNSDKCQRNVHALRKYCTNLFREEENVKICEGSLNSGDFESDSCLMIISVPYTRGNLEGTFLYESGSKNSIISPIMGKVETLTVSVYNHLGSSKNYFKSVFSEEFSVINIFDFKGQKSKCVPNVRLMNCGNNNNAVMKFSRHRNMLFIGSYEIANKDSECTIVESVWMSWSLWHIKPNHDEFVETPLQELNGNLFNVNGSFVHFPYGTFKLKNMAKGVYRNEIIHEKAYCYFQLVPVPVETVLLGGTLRLIDYKKDIHFTIVHLADLDIYEIDPSFQVRYTWKCDKSEENFCREYKTTKTTRVVKGPFIKVDKYIFTLTVMIKTPLSQRTEVSTINQTIVFTDSPSSDYGIICLLNCGSYVYRSNPDEIIHLELTHTEYLLTSGFTGRWWFKEESQKDVSDVSAIRENESDSNHWLTVRKSALAENKTYVFFVTKSTKSSSMKLAEIVIRTCKKNTKTICVVTPDSGERGRTFFDIKCASLPEDEQFTSTIYEFYNKHDSNDRIGRHLGFSTTGILNRVLLTRDKLYVYATNFFRVSSEFILEVKLTTPKHHPRLLKLGNKFIDNYIYRIGLISANADILLNSPSTFNATDDLVESLANEKVVETTGAILLGNALYNTACKSHDSGQITYVSLMRIAQITHRVSLILRDVLIDQWKTSLFVTTQTLQQVVKLMSNCCCMVLGHTDGYIFLDDDVQLTLRLTTQEAQYALDHLITAISFLYLPAYKERSFNLSHLTLKVARVTESEVVGWTNQQGPQRISSYGDYKNRFYRNVETDFGFYFQTVIYSINPYWWSNGNKIKTNIISRTLRKGVTKLYKLELQERHRFNLSVNHVYPDILSGKVSQPDPKDSPSINDFLVAVHRMDPPHDYSTSFIEFIELNQTLRVSILQDLRPDYDNIVSGSTLITKESSKLKFTVLGNNNMSFFYVGVLPGPEVKINETVGYSFKIIIASCNVWIYESWMTGTNCTVNNNTNEETLFCDCNLVTLTLGGGVYVPQSDFNPFSDIPLLIDVQDNTFIVAYIFIMLFLFLMLGLWTVTTDDRDEKRGRVIILGDNDPDDRFGYLIGVFTGSRVLAGTTSNVCVQLVGDGGSSRRHILKTRKRHTLQSNGEDWFVIFTHRHLECLKTIVIWTDFSGKRPNWYCSKIFVCDLTNFETYTFFVEKWLGFTMTVTRLYTRISCAVSKEINRTSRLFFENIVYGFRELHLWASVFFRHPRSLMNRTQRLSIALCDLLSIMVVCSALYSLSSYQYEGADPYSIKRSVVVVSVIASCSGSVISCMFPRVFRRCYEPVHIPSNIHQHNNYRSVYNIDRNLSDQQNKPCLLKYVQMCISTTLKPCSMIPVVSNRSITGFKINNLKNIVAWLLCIGIVLVECHLVVIFSWKRRSLNLLFWTSVGLAFFQTVLITLPMKIFINAYMFASIKTHYYQLLYHNLDEKKISNKIELRRQEHIDRCKDRARKTKYEIPDVQQIHKVRRVQKNNVRIWVMVYTISTVIFFFIICWHISHLSSSIQLFRKAVGCYEEQACVNRYTTVEEALLESLKNINKHVLPLLFQHLWYNEENLTSQEESFEETGWLNDHLSRLVGSPRLRQIRVKPGCRISSLAGVEQDCTLELSAANEDRESYSTGWERDGWTDSLFGRSPWVFTAPEEALGGIVISPSGYRCHGGGYIAYLKPNLKMSQIVIRDLINTKWVDKNTRVLIMEFTSFNPSSKTFTATNIVDEALPTGLILRSFTLQNVILSKITLSAVFFFIYFLGFLVTWVVLMNIVGLVEFLRSMWNVNELMILVVYFITIYYNIQYIQKRGEYQKKLLDQGKDVFFSVSEVVNHMEYTKNAIGILIALVSVRFLRIIGFNTDIRQYLEDLNNTRYEIFFIWINVVLFLYIQYRLIMYLLASPCINSMNDVLLLKSDFGSIFSNIPSAEGKVEVYFISLTSQFGTFSFIVSLAHYYKKILVKS